jgi:uncharacterized protein (DUF58 family)
MKLREKFADFLEKRWVSPAYSGLLLGTIGFCFFGAATNTMAGWLYVLSGTIFALLGLAAILPPRSLRQLKIRRLPITPVSVGDHLTLELEIENPTSKAKTLLQITDFLPSVLSKSVQTPIEVIPPQSVYRWTYTPTTQQRGVYQWHKVELRTGTPLGLFWCCRSRQVPAKAIVYPRVLPLAHCPLVDSLGQDESMQLQSDRRYHAATEGITRTLRPYRQGDPTRLIHWRSSAKLGQFQVRELEIITGGQEIIIALDTVYNWDFEDFEEAVITAASLYFYGSRCQLNVKLWTAETGLIHGNRVVLEALAATQPNQKIVSESLPNLPVISLTQNAAKIKSLPIGSRWVFFPNKNELEIQPVSDRNSSGLVIFPNESLQKQLQKLVRN